MCKKYISQQNLNKILISYAIIGLIMISLQTILIFQPLKQYGPRDNVHFIIDSSFEKYQTKQIIKAIYTWNRVGELNLTYSVENISLYDAVRFRSDNRAVIYNASYFSWKNVTKGLLTGWDDNILGFALIYSGDIFVSNNEYFYPVILHEIGHVIMGDYHSQDRDSVMFPYVYKNKKYEITGFDLLNLQWSLQKDKKM